ncbi:hypothetical protein THIOKS1550005 [Thiocapsa sp. KS1]|nr:hypothetical protein THIOKS1550005 [Thiocapsa sp. KS1]
MSPLRRDIGHARHPGVNDSKLHGLDSGRTDAARPLTGANTSGARYRPAARRQLEQSTKKRSVAYILRQHPRVLAHLAPGAHCDRSIASLPRLHTHRAFDCRGDHRNPCYDRLPVLCGSRSKGAGDGCKGGLAGSGAVDGAGIYACKRLSRRGNLREIGFHAIAP